MEKRYARAYGTGWKEKRLEQIGKIGEQLKKEYGLQAAVITGIEYVKEQKAAPALISDRNKKNSMQMGNLVVENGQLSTGALPQRSGAVIREPEICLPLYSVQGLVKENVYDDLCRAGSKFPFQSNCGNCTGGHGPK